MMNWDLFKPSLVRKGNADFASVAAEPTDE